MKSTDTAGFSVAVNVFRNSSLLPSAFSRTRRGRSTKVYITRNTARLPVSLASSMVHTTPPPPPPPPPSSAVRALQPSALQFSTESKRDDEKQSTHFLHTTLDHGHIQSHRHFLKTLGRATFSARIASYFQFLSVCPCPYVSSCLAVCWRSQALLERSHHPLP